MVVNFRARRISRGTRKLARTPILNYKKKILAYNLNAMDCFKLKLVIEIT